MRDDLPIKLIRVKTRGFEDLPDYVLNYMALLSAFFIPHEAEKIMSIVPSMDKETATKFFRLALKLLRGPNGFQEIFYKESQKIGEEKAWANLEHKVRRFTEDFLRRNVRTAEVQRVARKYMVRHADVDLVTGINLTLNSVIRYKDELKGMLELTNDLIKAGEARRLGRAEPIRPTDVHYDTRQITATVKGETGIYQTRITLPPKRGHHCTCPDWVQNGKTIGPCKHVLALGLYWQNQRVIPALYRLDQGVMSILEHSSI